MKPIKIILYGDPRTKKNSQQIIRLRNGALRIAPSKQYKAYEAQCLKQITGKHRQQIDTPSNVRMVYYMRTRRRVDLTNLQEATLDILVHAGVLADDNCKIAAAYDGSCVKHDKINPRVEIEIVPWDGETI